MVKWTYQTCEKEALKYKTKIEFRKNSSSAYTISVRNKWINDWFDRKIKPANYWNNENIINAARECLYYTEFRDNYISAFRKAKKNNLLSSFHWLTNDICSFDLTAKIHLIYVYEIIELKCVYVGRTINLANRDYSHRYKYKIINGDKKYDNLNAFCVKNNVILPKPIIVEHSLNSSDSQKREEYWINKYINNDWNKINKSKTGEGISSLGGGRIKWTYEKCYKEAKKYNSRGEFCEKSSQAYRVSLQYKWIDEYDWIKRIIKTPNYWNYERCYEEAKKYIRKKDFENNSRVAYAKSCREKWLKNYNWFINGYKKESKWTYEKCGEVAKLCKNKTDFSEKYNFAYRKCLTKKWINDFFL